jgi:hypothetical protein
MMCSLLRDRAVLGPRVMPAMVTLLAVACNHPTASGDPPNCPVSTAAPMSTPPSFSASVAQVTFEGGNGPAGPYAQYNVWVIVPPNTTPNAGVILPLTTPVFAMNAAGGVDRSSACALRPGMQVQVWHDFRWVFGSAEAPPGDTAYVGQQVVIAH